MIEQMLICRQIVLFFDLCSTLTHHDDDTDRAKETPNEVIFQAEPTAKTHTIHIHAEYL